MKRTIKLNSPLLPVLVVLIFVVHLIAPYRGWTILLAGLGGLWLVSYCWARSLANGLDLKREMRYGWAQVGDQLQERFTVTSHGWAPGLWIEIADHSSLPDYQASSVRAVGSGGKNRWYTRGLCTRRGLFSLGPTTLTTGDPFGLFTVSLHWPGWTDLMVTPPIIPLPAIEVAPGGRAGEGSPQPNAFEQTVSVASVRPHLPGDSLRWVHWPTSARHQSLYVRLFESTPSGDWWIVLDLNAGCQVGTGQHSTQEHGIILAASLADRGLRAGRQVGLIASGNEISWRSPQGGDQQRLAILRDLALLETGQRSLAELLSRLPTGTIRNASLIVITPDTGGEWIETLLPLRQRGTWPTVLLLDPASFGQADVRAERLLPAISRAGGRGHLIARSLLDRPEARPGRGGQWEWRITGTGRVVPVRRPADSSWRGIA